MFLRKILLAFLLLVLPAPAWAQSQGARMEVWANQTLTDPQMMADNPYMLGAPTSVMILPNFEAPLPPNMIQGNFTARILATFTIPAGGSTTFWCANNTKGKAWLSIDTPNFINRTPLCRSMKQPPPTSRQWLKYPEQRNAYTGDGTPGSANIGPVTLVAGRTYYLQMIFVESDGDNINHAAIGWQLPGSIIERPIPGIRLTPATYPPPPVMTMNFFANPLDIPDATSFVTLDWLVKNATACGATSSPVDATWSGPKSQLSGVQQISPPKKTDYALSCTPANGSSPQIQTYTITNSYNTKVTLSWDAPTLDRDGNPLTELGGYKLYFGTSPTSLPLEINVGNVTTFTITSPSFPSENTYYFAVSAYNTSGESGLSVERPSKQIYLP